MHESFEVDALNSDGELIHRYEMSASDIGDACEKAVEMFKDDLPEKIAVRPVGQSWQVIMLGKTVEPTVAPQPKKAVENMTVEELQAECTGMSVTEVREFHFLRTSRSDDKCVFLEMQDPELKPGEAELITLSTGRKVWTFTTTMVALALPRIEKDLHDMASGYPALGLIPLVIWNESYHCFVLPLNAEARPQTAFAN